MQFKVTNPRLERFIAEKVQTGDFKSPDAVVEDALIRMMEEEATLTDADVDAINAAELQIDGGEFVELDTFAAKMRQRFSEQ